MAINEFQTEQFLDVARARITDEFRGKPVMDKYLKLLIEGKSELQEVMEDVMTLRSLDTAVGVQLDVIGIIIGRPRGLVYSELFEYFGFQGATQGGSFGSLTDPSIGAPWYSIGAPTGLSREPSDDEYRLLLKAKIIKNRTMATPEDVIEAYKFLFGASQVTITELTGARARIGIGKILSAVERGLLFGLGGVGNLLPKTVGVEYSYSEFQSDRVFATEGFPGGIGTGDLNDPSSGGILSNLIT